MRRSAAACLLALAPALAQPAPRSFVLPGGLRVLLREDPTRVLFRARLQLALRPSDLPAGKEGAASLALRVMDRSPAGHLPAGSFARALDEAGIRIARRLSAGALTWDLVCRNRDQDRALGLLADRILRPLPDPAFLEPVRLALRREEAQAAPEQRLRTALGLDGPPPPTEASLDHLAFADLEAFRRRVFRPDRAVLVLEGDLDPEQAKALALLAFGTWTAPGADAPAATPPPAAPAPPLRLAGPGPDRAEIVLPAPPDLPPALRDLILLDLAGDPALAEVWCAPEGSTLHFRALAPAGSSADQALASLQARLAALGSRAPAAETLARAQAAWRGRDQVRSLHPGAQLDADLQAFLGEAARPEDVAAATPAQLQAALARWLAPVNQRSVLVSGPAPTP